MQRVGDIPAAVPCARLAPCIRGGYATGMTASRIFLIFVAAAFAACDTPHKTPPKKPAKKSSDAQGIGQKTENAFRHAGGAMEKFFTGHDTISR